MNGTEIEKYAIAIRKRLPPRYNIEKGKLKPKLKNIEGIKAILIDVYGTFITSPADGLLEMNEEVSLRKTIKEFGLNISFKKLKEQYYEGIVQEIERKARGGIKHPEVVIENIWSSILKSINAKGVNKFKIAYFFDWNSDRNKLYPNAFETLNTLKQNGLKLGIVSNAQFYTPLNLTLSLRKASSGKIKNWKDFFDPRLCTFSYKQGFSKPNKQVFAKHKKIFKSSEMIMVGNDILKDIGTAKKSGLNTVLFAGDKKSLRLRSKDPQTKGVKPDAVITDWKQLLKVIG
jgi:putative hydrolase of the HAD superfamily